MESPREKRLKQRLHCSQIHIKEKNKAERRLLSRRIEQINCGSRKVIGSINQQMKLLEDQMHERDIINEDNAAIESRLEIRSDTLSFQREQSLNVGHTFDPRTKSAPVYSRNNTNNFPQITSAKSFQARWMPAKEKLKPKCRFDTWGDRCRNFPCNKPEHYSHIGFDIRPNGTKSCDFKTGMHMFARGRESLLIDLESSSVRRPLRTSNDQTARKIVSLKKVIEDMKVKSDENRPKDWCTNYGKPISKRKLLKVARPNSIDVLQGV